MIKTTEQLRSQARLKNIKFYPVHRCSMCNYPCGYNIDGDSVYYDSGCDCVSGSHAQQRSWEDLRDTYNMNQPENNPNIKQKFLDELNEIWQFEK